jgi:alkaline phosphatase
MSISPRILIAAAFALLLGGGPTGIASAPAGAQSTPPHNVIIFVPDGLRASMVDAVNAPEMNAVKTHGVTFANSHSIFPTFTTANASSMATGHYLGDTGDFSNAIYSGFRTAAAGGSQAPFLESDTVLQEMSKHYGGISTKRRFSPRPACSATARRRSVSSDPSRSSIPAISPAKARS